MNAQSSSVFMSDGKNAIHDGIEHEPGGGKALLDPTDTVFYCWIISRVCSRM